jgi:hypothetical protein
MQPSALVEQAAAGDLIADRAAWWPQLQIVLQRIATQGFLCGAGRSDRHWPIPAGL